jgi:hypothetical protein
LCDMKETKTAMATSWFHEKNMSELASIQYSLAWKVPVQHIFLLLSGTVPLTPPQPLGENTAPWIFELLSITKGLGHHFLHNVLVKKLLKYNYSISQALSTVLRSTNSTKFLCQLT